MILKAFEGAFTSFIRDLRTSSYPRQRKIFLHAFYFSPSTLADISRRVQKLKDKSKIFGLGICRIYGYHDAMSAFEVKLIQ